MALDPRSPARDRVPGGDFEWPPTEDLSIHAIGGDAWASPGAPVEATTNDAAPPADGAPRAPWWRRLRPLTALVIATAIVVGLGWRLARDVRDARPAEAGDVPVAARPASPDGPAPEDAAVPPVTIVVTYPVEATRPAPAAESLPSPLATASVVEAAGVRTARPRAPDMTAFDAPAAPVSSPLAAASPSALDAVGASPALPPPSPAAVAPTSAAPTPVAPTPVAPTSAAHIRGILERYEAAYDRRDVDAAAVLWPSLDRRALGRAFASLARQDVEFERCDIDADLAHGTAICVGTVTYVPTVGRGDERATRIVWTFDLTRTGDDWRIATLRAR